VTFQDIVACSQLFFLATYLENATKSETFPKQRLRFFFLSVLKVKLTGLSFE